MPLVDTPSTTDPNSSAGNYGSASRMAGSGEDVDPTQSAPGSGAPQGDPQQALANVTSVLRQAEESIVALSKQFPQASEDIRKAREAIRKVMTRIISNPGGGETPSPRTGV